jgi:hypothetical protein
MGPEITCNVDAFTSQDVKSVLLTPVTSAAGKDAIKHKRDVRDDMVRARFA